MKVWRDYDQAELDRQYDHRTRIPNAPDLIARIGALSQECRDALPVRRDLVYGAHGDERFDLYGEGSDRPVQVFFHGGQWRLLSKEEGAAQARLYVGAGALFVAAGFSRVDEVGMDRLAGQAAALVAHVCAAAASWGGDPEQIYVSGHSSGAHLAAMALEAEPRLRGALLLAGLYDLEPVRLTFRNEWLKLDAAAARRNSPAAGARQLDGTPVLVAWGSLESDEFKRQSRAYVASAEARGARVEASELTGANHFDPVFDLCEARTPLARAALVQMGLG